MTDPKPETREEVRRHLKEMFRHWFRGVSVREPTEEACLAGADRMIARIDATREPTPTERCGIWYDDGVPYDCPHPKGHNSPCGGSFVSPPTPAAADRIISGPFADRSARMRESLRRMLEPAPTEPSARAVVLRALRGSVTLEQIDEAVLAFDRALTDERKAAEERAIEAAAQVYLDDLAPNMHDATDSDDYEDSLRARLAQDRGNG